MTAKIIPINSDKAVALIRDFVREWRLSGLTAQDIVDEFGERALREGIVDEFGERALREGIVSKRELDAWDDESFEKTREARRREVYARAFKPIPPWR